MKRVLIIFAFIVGLSLTANAQLKFGHFNSQAFLEQMPEIKTVQKTIDDEASKIEKQLTTLQEEFNKMQQDYQNSADKLTDEQKAEKMNELQETYQKIQLFVQSSRQQLNIKQQELLAPIMQKVNRIVQEVGAENEFIYIFEEKVGFVLSKNSQSIDITPLVKKKLGIN